MAEVELALVRDADVPAGDTWLGPRERVAQERFAMPRRRTEWRAGRWAARRALAALDAVDVSAVEILASSDGAPEPWRAGTRLPLHLSISHRGGIAAALATRADAVPGCDVELIEPRPATFYTDWFTPTEIAEVERTSGVDRDFVVTLIWSAKETASKALRTGLAIDTREIEISLGDGTFEASTRQARMSGWWKRDGALVITTVVQETKR